MTNPPPPGNWGPPQSGPQSPHNQAQPPYGQGSWPQQQGWGHLPPQRKNSGIKYLLIGVAVLLVVAISVGATLLFTRNTGDSPTADGSPSPAGDIASANDDGPAAIITEDPSCAPSRAIFDALSATQKKGWNSSDFAKPSTTWNDNERRMYTEVADAMRRAADQSVELAKLTPHRVMRELYTQAIAYWRAYADSIRDYTAADHELAKTAGSASSAVVWICTAVSNETAATWGPLIEAAPQPLSPTTAIDVDSPSMFMGKTPNSKCQIFKDTIQRFEAAVAPWYALDASLTATQWTSEQRRSMDRVAAEMVHLADELEAVGQSSGDGVFNDFSSLAAQYWRAFAKAMPTYTTADSYLSSAATSLGFVIFDACTYSSGK
ncbi:MAG: hypothetical protein PGN30_08975 [Mycolicibacterium neoaurum]|uniref:hypothetical protein n=1 Tax=Mycolicibacterium neoaurum TaxID=1795 RepID=UPI002FF4B2E7